MTTNNLQAIIESLLFVSGDEGLSISRLAEIIEKPHEDIQGALESLEQECKFRGVTLVEIGGAYQLVTKKEYAPYIEKLVEAPANQSLSQAALETLAIVAYKQPITRAEIEEIRGVAVGSVLKSLHERGLIDVVGRAEGLGRPLLYGTTPVFLEHFALRHLEELPRADELAIALRVQPRETESAAVTEASE